MYTLFIFMGTLAVSGQFTPGVKSGLPHGEKPRSVCRRNKETRFPSSLRESWVGCPPAHSLFQVSLECEIQHLPLFYLNQVFVFKKKRFG